MLEADVGARIGSFELACDLAVESGKTIALVGESGAGKTSMLRAIAGLLHPGFGRIACNGEVWFDSQSHVFLSPQRRNCGMVFAEYALFGRMSALENVLFGLRAVGDRKRARQRAQELMDLLGIGQLASRRASLLSSGEQQRVALARALAIPPAVLLLDEPFSAIDVERRAPVREALLRFVADSGAAAVIVTHEPIEAMLFAQQLVVLQRGAVVQRGTADELRYLPRTSYIATFFGINFYQGEARAQEGGTSIIEVNDARFTVMGSWSGRVALVVEPDAVVLSKTRPDSSARNVLAGPVTEVGPEGNGMRVVIASHPRIVARVTRQSISELGIQPGENIVASFKAGEVTVHAAS
jgi:molybdate transport system ATP-binding protein